MGFVQRTPTSYFHGAAYTAAGARRPLTTANLLLRRSSSLLSLTSPEHDEHHRLPELSRTNSVTTCSSEGGSAGMLRTPPHIPFEDFEVLSEEDEQQQEDGDVFFTSSSSSSKAPNSHPPISQESSTTVIHASPPPTLLKRPGLPRRDTPIPSAAASSHPSSSTVAINKPSKSFRTSLSPVPVSIPVPKADAPWSSVATTSTGSGKPQRPTLKRRDTPRPPVSQRPVVAQFTTFTTPTSFISSVVGGGSAPVSEDVRTGTTGRSMNIPNFFSTSLRLSLLRASSSSSLSDGEAVVVQEEDEEEEESDAERSPISISSSCSEESFTSYAHSPTSLPAPIRKYVGRSLRAVKRLRSSGGGGREGERSFSSVLDGKVWVAV
ncbi:hypothetical protein QFC22_001606 [Naganishia vaughanmartiniae]|uniref:Uncharacterized protein n=1 Tax=Naganishia vaughanmartiniae TaxID=1424756 RepID=A0ACC2XJ43_9TREE|nr:hypothetical protein QFC22_001606 [Naganishia vaughanmartiniae]